MTLIEKGRAAFLPLDPSTILTSCGLVQSLQANGVQVPKAQAWEALWPMIEQTASHLQKMPRDRSWGSYLIVSPSPREPVGICGFKDAPRSGIVEIAYHTFPAFERRGFATAAAAFLRDVALTSSLVSVVTARTLREQNASTRILARCGFSCVGDVNDPEDGCVWQWEYPARPDSKPPGLV